MKSPISREAVKRLFVLKSKRIENRKTNILGWKLSRATMQVAGQNPSRTALCGQIDYEDKVLQYFIYNLTYIR